MFFRWKHKRVAGVITVALLCLRIFYRCADYSVLVILSYKYPSERESQVCLVSCGRWFIPNCSINGFQ